MPAMLSVLSACTSMMVSCSTSLAAVPWPVARNRPSGVMSMHWGLVPGSLSRPVMSRSTKVGTPASSSVKLVTEPSMLPLLATKTEGDWGWARVGVMRRKGTKARRHEGTKGERMCGSFG